MCSRSVPRAAVPITGNPWDLEGFQDLPSGRDRWEHLGIDAQGSGL